ncbi:MAG: hypothetical protein M5U34_37475 [Chloroflexi bacterium]|nr:hypothetical protein [Chloroflexota bacterium]
MSVIKSTVQWSKSLKGQMAISYVLVTLISILISELLIFGGALFLLTGENSLAQRVERTAIAFAKQLPPYFNNDSTFKTGFFRGFLFQTLIPPKSRLTLAGLLSRTLMKVVPLMGRK